MEPSELRTLIAAHFKKNQVPISQSALELLMSPQYLQKDTLAKMEPSRATDNVRIVLNDIIRNYHEYLEKQFRIKRKWWRPAYLTRKSLENVLVTDKEIKPVMDKYANRLPPYGQIRK